MSRGFSVAAILAPALLGLLTACATPESGEGTAQGRQLQSVRIHISPSIKFAPLMIAKDEGYFAEEGIDAEFVTADAPSALLATVSGDVDVYPGPVRSAIFNLIIRGSDIRVVAGKGDLAPGPCPAEAFVAPSGMAARIAAAGTIRGEKIAVIRGGVTEYLIDQLIAKYGLTRADVELTDMPQGDHLTRSTMKVEAIRYLAEPHLSQQIASGEVKIVATSEDVAPGHQHDVLVYGGRLLRNDPDLGHRFMRAYLRGVRRYGEGKLDRSVDSISRHTGLPPEIIRGACWMRIAEDGQIPDPAIQPLLDWLLKVGYLEKAVARPEWWDPRFVDAAVGRSDGTETTPAPPPDR